MTHNDNANDCKDCSPKPFIRPPLAVNCQHCDEQEFQTLSCVHYTIFSVVILDCTYEHCYWMAFLLGKTTRTPRVHLVLLNNSQVQNVNKVAILGDQLTKLEIIHGSKSLRSKSFEQCILLQRGKIN